MVTKLQLNIVFLTLCDSREVSSSCHINFSCFNPGLPLKSKADQLYTNQHLGGSFLIQDHHRWVVFDLACRVAITTLSVFTSSRSKSLQNCHNRLCMFMQTLDTLNQYFFKLCSVPKPFSFAGETSGLFAAESWVFGKMLGEFQLSVVTEPDKNVIFSQPSQVVFVSRQDGSVATSRNERT